MTTLIESHFAPDVAKRFKLILETEKYRTSEVEGVWRQKRDNKLIMEIYYSNPGVQDDVFICDVASWWDRKTCEAVLLRGITDAYKSGKIRFSQDRVNQEIITGVHETPDEVEEVVKP